ncbi:MAG: hypothetical protein ACLT3Y_00285 [Ruminococcus callidus]
MAKTVDMLMGSMKSEITPELLQQSCANQRQRKILKAMEETIRIGSRANRLAVIQSELVMAEIRRIQPAAKLNW